MSIKQLKNQAREVRKLLLTAAFRGKSGHIGSALSAVDIITALYFSILKVNPKKPRGPGRDIFILSKGHGCLGLYATLALKGFFPKKQLLKYGGKEKVRAVSNELMSQYDVSKIKFETK